MTIPLSPCKGCADRHAACWDSCKKYKRFKAEAEKINAGRRKYNEDTRDHFVDIWRAKKNRER